MGEKHRICNNNEYGTERVHGKELFLSKKQKQNKELGYVIV
jgi:hypothetical protein